MAIPTPPPNTTKATARELTYDNRNDEYFFMQQTSTYGYTPPDPPVPPLYYDLWFKAFDIVNCKGSVTVHNQSLGLSDTPVVTVYDEADNVLGLGNCVQFERSTHPTSGWYYFKVHTPQNNPTALCEVSIVIKLVRGGPILASSIVIQNEPAKEPLSIIIGTTQAFNFIRHTINASNPTDTNHTLNGKCGDTLPSGETCVEDQAIKGVTIRNKYYGVPLTEAGEDGSVSRPLGLTSVNDLYHIRRNADGRNFWLSYLLAGTPIVRSIAVTGGVLGPVFDLGGKVVALCTKADQAIYYTLESDINVVRRWDLVNNRRAANLTVPTAPVKDIIITATGEIIVLYVFSDSAHVYRYNEAGTVLSAFQLPTVNNAARINYAGSNPNQFVLWTHEPGISLFRWVNLINGQIYDPVKSQEFNSTGAYVNVADLYGPLQFGYYKGPVQRVGGGQASNFWIQPVVSRGGCYVPYTVPPDDEYIPPVFPPYQYPQYPPETPGGVYPYPPDPPQTPPVIPIEPPPPIIVNPENIGGGIMIIDPSNATRHDVYQGRNAGETLQASIIAYIRTAFLGD